VALEGVELNPGTGGATVATDTVGGLDYQVIKLAVGADGAASLVSDSDPLPVSGTVTANAGTDLNTSALALESGGNLDAIAASAAAIETAVGGTLAVSGPLTDTELRAAPVVVDLGANNDVTVTGSVTVTDGSGSLTVDGTVTANLGAVDNAVLDSIDAAVNGTLAVSGPLTDAELRANPVVVDLGSNNDVTVTGTVDLGATDNAVLDAIAASLATLDNAVAGNELQVDVVSSALPSGASTSAKQDTIIGHLDGVEGVLGTIDADTGSIATSAATVAGAVSGSEMQVDVITLPTVTANIAAAAASGGATPYKNLDVDESEDEIKGSAGKLFWLHAINLSNAKRYLKFYNATAANVTVGTTTPVLTFPIPTFADTNGAGFTINFGDAGLQFSTAITVAATTGFADNDTGAPGANEIIVNLGYL
jgi:hypothetical protein